jgi:predicted nucleotidyltransferase
MNFFELKCFLEKHLKKTVDLGMESVLKPAAKEHISKEIIHV